MFFGFIAIIFNFVSYWIALPFVGITWILLSYDLFVVNLFSSLPFASINISFAYFSASVFIIFTAYVVYKYFYKKEFDQKPIRVSDGWEIEDISDKDVADL